VHELSAVAADDEPHHRSSGPGMVDDAGVDDRRRHTAGRTHDADDGQTVVE
jgi:hypothetical protein